MTDHSEFWRERYFNRLNQIAELQIKLSEQSNSFNKHQAPESESLEIQKRKSVEIAKGNTVDEMASEFLDLQIRIKAMNSAEDLGSDVITDLGKSAITAYSRVTRIHSFCVDPQITESFINAMEHFSEVIINQGYQQDSLATIKGLHFLFYSTLVNHPYSHFSKICTITNALCRTLPIPSLYELAQHICIEAIKEISASFDIRERYARLVSTTHLSVSILTSINEASSMWGDNRKGFLRYYGNSLRKIRFKLQKVVTKTNHVELMDAVFSIRWTLLD